jgi:phosphatidylserine/phosphatidylglycerophosphate/cardiolipin synthase-like enzyme
MEGKINLILTGVIIGTILGVELVHYSTTLACPHNINLELTEVVPIWDRGYFPEAHKQLQQARKSIHMAQFELKYYEKHPNSSVNILIKDIIEAHKRGVDVKIIVDEFSEVSNAFDILKQNGIEVKMDPKNTTTHTKLIIIDGETVILGSTNLSYYALELNNEVNVMLKNSRTAEYYEKYFWNLWNSN